MLCLKNSQIVLLDKRTDFQRRRSKHDHRKAFVGKIGAFCVVFFARTETNVSLGLLGLKAWATHLAPSRSLQKHKPQAGAIAITGGFFTYFWPPFIRWILACINQLDHEFLMLTGVTALLRVR